MQTRNCLLTTAAEAERWSYEDEEDIEHVAADVDSDECFGLVPRLRYMFTCKS